MPESSKQSQDSTKTSPDTTKASELDTLNKQENVELKELNEEVEFTKALKEIRKLEKDLARNVKVEVIEKEGKSKEIQITIEMDTIDPDRTVYYDPYRWKDGEYFKYYSNTVKEELIVADQYEPSSFEEIRNKAIRFWKESITQDIRDMKKIELTEHSKQEFEKILTDITNTLLKNYKTINAFRFAKEIANKFQLEGLQEMSIRQSLKQIGKPEEFNETFIKEKIFTEELLDELKRHYIKRNIDDIINFMKR